MGFMNLKWTGIAATASFAVAALLFVVTFDGKITGFFRIGDVLPLSPFVEEASAKIIHGEVGYDGQMFLTIALDPTLDHPGTIAALDNPKYRYKRIAYPLAGYVLGLGRPAFIPYALVALNLICIAGLVLIVGMFPAHGLPDGARLPSPLWILALPGIWVTLCLSTSDLLGLLLFIGALLLLKSGRYVAASAVLCVACFTRETYAAVAVTLAAFMLLRRRPRSAASLLVCILPPLAWIAFVGLHINHGTSGARENLSFPFMGIIAKLWSFADAGMSASGLFECYSFLLLLATVILVAVSITRACPDLDVAHVAAVPCIAILAVSKMQILEYHANYLRIFMDAWVILLLVPGSKSFNHARTGVLLLSGIGSLAYVLNYVIS